MKLNRVRFIRWALTGNLHPYRVVAVCVLVIILVLVIQNSIILHACQVAGTNLGLNWFWHPVKGCYLQLNGSWILIDHTRPFPFLNNP